MRFPPCHAGLPVDGPPRPQTTWHLKERAGKLAENFIPKMMGRKEKVASLYLNMAYMAMFGIYVMLDFWQLFQ